MKTRLQTTATVLEAKTHFSRLLRQVKNGEVVTITSGREKKPVAKLIPAEESTKPRLGPLGALAHLNIRIPDEFFFDPLPPGWSGEDD